MRSDRSLWAPFLFALLCVPLLLTVTGTAPNDVRVDTIEEPPGFAPGRLLDVDYYREVDDWVADRFPARGMGMWTRIQIDYGLLGDVTNPNLLAGPEPWLHRADSANPSCDNLDQLDIPGVADGRSDVTFIVEAPKAAVQPWTIDPDDVAACVGPARHGWRERLGDHPAYLDVNRALRERASAGGPTVFYETDGHWTQDGRLLVAETLVDHLGPGLWDPDAITDLPVAVRREMDVARGLGLRQTGVLRDRTIERDGEVEVDRVSAVESLGAHFPLVEVSRSTAADVVDGTTLLVGDSQMGYLLPEIRPYFEELVFVNWVQLAIDATALDGLPPPDRAVFAAVENNAAALFASPFVDATIATLSGSS